MKSTSSFVTHFPVKPLVLSLGTALLGMQASTAGAATGADTWLGNTDVNWATGANWTSGSANKPPIAGDSLIFGAVARPI